MSGGGGGGGGGKANKDWDINDNHFPKLQVCRSILDKNQRNYGSVGRSMEKSGKFK